MIAGLPNPVRLPTVPTAKPGIVYAALNASRQRARYWRIHDDFPEALYGRLDMQAVAAWVAERGSTVQWL